MSSVVTSMKRKIHNTGDEKNKYDSLSYFGTQPDFILSSKGAGSNNLEEQLIVGSNKIITTWRGKNDVAVTRTEYRPLDGDTGYYFTDHYVLSEALLIDFDKAIINTDEYLQLPLVIENKIETDENGNDILVPYKTADFLEDTREGYLLGLRNEIKDGSQYYEFIKNEDDDYYTLKIRNIFTEKDRNKVIEYTEFWYSLDSTHSNPSTDRLISIKNLYQPFNYDDGHYIKNEYREEIIPKGYISREEYETLIEESNF